MGCVHPVPAYRLTGVFTDKGKAKIVFSSRVAREHAYEEIKLPCGGCSGCRLAKAKEWSVRCVHEASLYDMNCFITLTKSELCLDHEVEKCAPARGEPCRVYKQEGRVCMRSSLCLKDFPLFMKRLRKFASWHEWNDRVGEYVKLKRRRKPGIRFYQAGEYGSCTLRPHHHACLFNWDFQDKVLWKKCGSGMNVYRSALLESLWPFGFSSVGCVSWQSAAYVARYIMKKKNGKLAKEAYRDVEFETGEVRMILPEHCSMSRRPGVALDWIREFGRDVYPKDFTTIGGKKFSAPKYYDKVFEMEDPECMEAVRLKRRRAAKESDSYAPERLASKRIISQQRCDMLVRGL